MTARFTSTSTSGSGRRSRRAVLVDVAKWLTESPRIAVLVDTKWLTESPRNCGTTGGIEGAWQLATAKLHLWSEQQLEDCPTQKPVCQCGNATNLEHDNEVANEATGAASVQRSSG